MTSSRHGAGHLEKNPPGTSRLVWVYTWFGHGLYQRSVYTYTNFFTFGISWYIPGITFFLKLYQVYTKISKLYQIANNCNRYILCIYLSVYLGFIPGLYQVYLELNLLLHPDPRNAARNQNCLPSSRAAAHRSSSAHRFICSWGPVPRILSRRRGPRQAKLGPSPAAVRVP